MGQLKRQLVMWGAIATTTAVLPGLALAELAGPEHGGGRHGRGDRHGRDHRHDDAKLSVAGRAISKGTTDSYGLQIRGRRGDEPTAASGMLRFAHRGENVMEGLVGEITCLSKDSAGVVAVTGTIVRSGRRDGKADNKDGAKNDGEKKDGDKKESATPGAPSLPTASDADADALLDELAPWDDAGSSEPVHGRDGRRDRRGRRGEGERDRDRRGSGELAGKDFAVTISVAGKPQKFSQPTVGEKGSLAACSGGGVPTAEVTRGGFRVREAGGADNTDDAKDGTGDNDRDGRRGRRGWFR